MHQLCRALALSTKSILQYLIRLFGDIDFSLYLCTRSIKSSRSYRSGLANRASSERGRAIAQPSYSISATVVSTMWEIYSLQKTKSYATTHLLHQVCPAVRRHADSRVSNIFNSQVQNRGWSSMRAYHDQALIDEFRRRGIDITAVSDGKTTSFAHPVRYDLPDNKLIAIG